MLVTMIVGIVVTSLTIAILSIISTEHWVRKKGIHRVMMEDAKKTLRKKTKERIKKLIKNYCKN